MTRRSIGNLARAAFPALLALLSLLPGAVGAEDRPDDALRLTADQVEYETQRDLYVARGNVVIVQPERTLTADWVAFSNTTRQGVAAGNVVLVQGPDVVTAEFLEFEVDEMLGVLFQATLDAGKSGFLMEAETVRKTGAETYEFENGKFSTCRCPEEGRKPWEIKAKEADLEVDGYATARNTTVEILGVPVLWLPYSRYPLKTDRESGILFPVYEQSGRSGTILGLPIFWAARDNVNLTFTPHWVSERGFMPVLEAEYVFGERSRGDFYASYLYDNEINPDDASTRFDRQRWAVEWLHDQDLPLDARLAVDARAFSDNLYVFDLPGFNVYRQDRFIESRALVEKRLGGAGLFGLTGSVWWADDMQNPNDQDRDDFLLQRLPDLQASAAAQSPPGLPNWVVASFDTDYTWFQPRRRQAGEQYETVEPVGNDLFLDIGIDALPNGEERDQDGNKVPGDASGDDFPGPEGDGRFQEGEPQADKGHRVLLNPRLALPFRLFDVFEVTPEAAYHGTLYHSSNQDFESRHLATGQVDLRTRLRGSAKLPFGMGRATHLLEPRLAWTGVTSQGQKDNPLYVPTTFVPQDRLRQLDLLNVTRDPADRIDSANLLTLAFGNRLYLPGVEGPSRLVADFTISTQYDLSESVMRNFYLDGRLFSWGNVTSDFNFGWDWDDAKVSEALLSLSWFHDDGHDLAVSYRYLEEVPRFFENFRFDGERFSKFREGFLEVNQVDFFARYAITRHWAVTYAAQFSFEEKIFLTNRGGIEYTSKCLCWAVRLELEDDRQGGVRFNLGYRLLGLGADTVRPFSRGGRNSSRTRQVEEESLNQRLAREAAAGGGAAAPEPAEEASP